MSSDITFLLQKALEHTREGVTISDALQPGYPLIYVNKGFLKMTGYSYEEVIGQSFLFLRGKDTDLQTVEYIRNAITSRQPVGVEILNYTKSKESFWDKLSITPVFDPEGRFTHFISIHDNITSLKEATTIEKMVAHQKLITQISLQAQEKERDEIGKELHDNINQLLATCKLYLNIAYTDSALRMTMIQQTDTLINTAIEEIRKLSKALVGPGFDVVSLHESIEDLVDSLRVAVPFKISYCSHKLQEDKLSQSKKLILFRIVQEQLNNIIKHAHAKNVSITIAQFNNCIALTITDDGVGFDTTENFEGIGLKNINSRVALENGIVQVNSMPGKGCEMKIELPL